MPYLDASAILPTLVDEPASPVMDTYMAHAHAPFIVSEFAAAEVASGLSRRVRMGGVSLTEARKLLNEFDSWRASATEGVEIGQADVRLAHTFVRRFELMLRTPDALHLAICRRTDNTMVTMDRRMASAAIALGIAVEPLA